MAGRMIEFTTEGPLASGYLATPTGETGPGVVVLHAWWGLTEPFRQACDRLAEAGFAALAPDLYRGKTTASIEEAEVLSSSLVGEDERVRSDIQGAVQYLRQQTGANSDHGKLAFLGFSMGGAYAFTMSVDLAEEIAAVVTFYATYSGPDFQRAKAAYLCHFAENDPYEPAESVVEMEETLEAAGKQTAFYTYPGTTHWFFEANRPDAYNPSAAALAWERTITFLHAQLDQA